MQFADKGLAYRHLVEITRYTQVWFGKLWNPKGRIADYYLCDNCRDVLMYWLEGDPRQPRKKCSMTGEEKGEDKKFVSVVRCGECRHKCGEHDGYICCDIENMWRDPNWFCAEGERKDDGNDQR